MARRQKPRVVPGNTRKVRVEVDAGGRISYSPDPMTQDAPLLPQHIEDGVVDALADALVADFRQSRDGEQVA